MKNRIFLVFTLILVIGLLSTLTATTKAQTSGTSITLYAGSVNSGSGTYGYGTSASKITSPAPTLNLVEGTTYTITVDNVATDMTHSFEIVSTKAISSKPLFGAGIDINSYIPAGGSGNVTFTPNQTGNFYYVCTVPAHISLGMWGNVVVSTTTPSPTIPEFPSALTLMFMALVITALAAFVAREKIRPKNIVKL